MTLTRWLQGHTASSAAVPPFGSPGWQKADAAIRSIGTNAIPTLVRKLPPPIRKIIGDLSDTERTLVGLQMRSRNSEG